MNIGNLTDFILYNLVTFWFYKTVFLRTNNNNNKIIMKNHGYNDKSAG